MDKDSRVKTVLVIEDEDIIRQSFRDQLEDMGFRVLDAENGRDGLDAIKRDPPDLVLTDLRMPEMDGLEFIMHSQVLAPDTPIIVISGMGRIDEAIEAMRRGAYDYLSKPVKEIDLMRHTIDRALEKARLQRKNRIYQERLEELVDERTWELERSERLLQLSKARFEDFTDSGPDWFWEMGPDLCFTFVTGKIEDVMGLKSEEIIGRTQQEIYRRSGDLDSPEWLQHLKCIGDHQPFSNFEMPWLRPDGGNRFISMGGKPRHDENGCFQGYWGVGRDITMSRKVEQALRESEQQQRDLLNNTSSVIYIKDLDGRYLFINRMFEELFHISYQKIKGKTDHNVFPQELADAFRVNDLKVLDADTILEFEEVACQEDRNKTYISVKFPLKRTSGETYAVCSISTDITERKLAEDALGRSEERYRMLSEELEERVQARTVELTEAMQELESFSYSVSHDLKAPLRGIHGYGKMLLDDFSPQLPADAQRYLTMMCQEAETMGRLVNDLLLVSRLGRKALERVELDMGQLVQSVFTELMQTEPERPVCLHVSPDLPLGFGDSTLIRQVLINLIANALKFTRPRDPAVIEVEGKVDESHCLYIIKDNGVGFEMQYYNKLFGVFERLHSKEEFEGTGVGLAIVQRIIRRHGGAVQGNSVLKKGAMFSFTLPRKGTVL